MGYEGVTKVPTVGCLSADEKAPWRNARDMSHHGEFLWTTAGKVLVHCDITNKLKRSLQTLLTTCHIWKGP